MTDIGPAEKSVKVTSQTLGAFLIAIGAGLILFAMPIQGSDFNSTLFVYGLGTALVGFAVKIIREFFVKGMTTRNNTPKNKEES